MCSSVGITHSNLIVKVKTVLTSACKLLCWIATVLEGLFREGLFREGLFREGLFRVGLYLHIFHSS